MIISNLLHNTFKNGIAPTTWIMPELIDNLEYPTISGQNVTVETSKNVATAYRCINILSDDLAKMPLQTFVSRLPGQIDRVRPTNRPTNIAWLLEISPNRWMTPFVLKKTIMQWLVCWGNTYVWKPPRLGGQREELFILNANTTSPLYDIKTGEIWYQTRFASGEMKYLPYNEVMHLLINSTDGINGRSVITYARETLGRQMGAYETQGRFYAQGMNPSGVMYMKGDLNKEAREKVRDTFQAALGGTSNAYGLAVMDEKVSKFEPITMKPVDVQFLESIQENDLEIANYFGVPLYKLDRGKQSYASNEQSNLDYLSTTLDPYLVQFEQTAMLQWLSEEEQNYVYLRFNRDVLLRTDAKTRSEYLEKNILSGQMTPNEARQINDLPAYEGGDDHYIPMNMGKVGGRHA